MDAVVKASSPPQRGPTTDKGTGRERRPLWSTFKVRVVIRFQWDPWSPRPVRVGLVGRPPRRGNQQAK